MILSNVFFFIIQLLNLFVVHPVILTTQFILQGVNLF